MKFEKVRLAYIRTYGPSNFEVARIENNLATALHSLEKFADSAKIKERILPIYVEKYGKDHIEVGKLSKSLAVTL